ncbi:hypothetical protein AAG906_003090 [Vitis piasezkii]
MSESYSSGTKEVGSQWSKMKRRRSYTPRFRLEGVYRKFNVVIRKDHFPLPFIDQIEKTTFTCPFGTYAYVRMPFGLCNAPTTFQRCMLSIFSDMVERIMEVFMDDITIYGSTFEECLVNLEAVRTMMH